MITFKSLSKNPGAIHQFERGGPVKTVPEYHRDELVVPEVAGPAPIEFFAWPIVGSERFHRTIVWLATDSA